MPPTQNNKCSQIYQVFYNDNTRKSLDSQFIPYENLKCSKYFESKVIVDLYEQGKMQNCDYFGVVSWRIWQKVSKVCSLEEFILSDGKAHDFYYANWWWRTNNSIWKQTETWVGTDLTTWPRRLMVELGYEIDFEKLNILPSFYNYQICRTELYKEYVERLLLPIMRMMDDPSREELQVWLNEPVNYSRSPSVTGMKGRILKKLLSPLATKDRDRFLMVLSKVLGRFQTTNPNLVSSNSLQSITGRPYYTRHSFVMEALFPTYAALRGWSGKPFST
jgi:hypothetical protein